MPQVGRLTWDYFEKGVPTESKADDTPVTIADREGEQLIRQVISKHFPDDGFLGEEYGEQPGPSGFKWIIDPIDATKNFVRGIHLFGNLVGLEKDGEMVGGFTYVPAFNDLYYGIKGHGAFKNERPIHVSDVKTLDQAQLGYSGIDYFDRSNTTDAFLKVSRQVVRTRAFGDFFGFLQVASGVIEFVLEPTLSAWDIASLYNIVVEAGGTFTDWNGNDTIYNKSAIASNGHLHQTILEAVRTA